MLTIYEYERQAEVTGSAGEDIYVPPPCFLDFWKIRESCENVCENDPASLTDDGRTTSILRRPSRGFGLRWWVFTVELRQQKNNVADFNP